MNGSMNFKHPFNMKETKKIVD